jgi:hypothetical protein
LGTPMISTRRFPPAERDALPTILYKYYPAKRIDIFGTWSARFTRPSQFNDTFDSYYATEMKSGSSTRLKFRNQLGIFCMTEDPDNHLMWVHYSDNHEGFVVGFKTNAPFLAQSGRELKRVKYESEPPEVLFAGEPPLLVCCYKAKEWDCEKEWRCIQKFKPSESRDVMFDPGSISEVILGSKISNQDLLAIVGFVEALGPEYNIPISRSKPDKARWAFTHERVDIHVCPQCSGDGYIETKHELG